MPSAASIELAGKATSLRLLSALASSEASARSSPASRSALVSVQAASRALSHALRDLDGPDDDVGGAIAASSLEALGWSGHLVEASPSEFAELVKTRANSSTGVKLIQKCAHPTARTIELMNMGPMSTLSDSAEIVARNRRHAKLRPQDPGSMTSVECAPLDELTAGTGPVIDIMFLDCEGCELDALRSLRFDETSVGLLVVEMRWDDAAYAPDTQPHPHPCHTP